MFEWQTLCHLLLFCFRSSPVFTFSLFGETKRVLRPDFRWDSVFEFICFCVFPERKWPQGEQTSRHIMIVLVFLGKEEALTPDPVRLYQACGGYTHTVDILELKWFRPQTCDHLLNHNRRFCSLSSLDFPPTPSDSEVSIVSTWRVDGFFAM